MFRMKIRDLLSSLSTSWPFPDFIDASIGGKKMKWEGSMPETIRRQFTDAFKPVAVRLMRESGQPVAQVVGEG